jgi:hypothetical protein
MSATWDALYSVSGRVRGWVAPDDDTKKREEQKKKSKKLKKKRKAGERKLF